MRCTNCEKEIIDDAVFCPYCGKTIANESGCSESKPAVIKKNKKLYRIIAICLIAIILIIAIVFISRIVRRNVITEQITNPGISYYNSDHNAYSPWQENTLESELMLCHNGDADSVLLFPSYARSFHWEINNSLDFVITYTSGKDEKVVYSYSNDIEKSAWHYDDTEKILYLGNREYHLVDSLKYDGGL